MSPPSPSRALGPPTPFLVAALVLGAIARVMRPRAAAARYALPNGAEIRSEP